MTRSSPISSTEIKDKLNRHIEVAQMIVSGLSGKPFNWGDTERQAYTEKAKHMGITLVTVTGAKKLGHQLRPRAEPIGTVYFGAPLKVHTSVYVLECQCQPINKASEVSEDQIGLELTPPSTDPPAETSQHPPG